MFIKNPFSRRPSSIFNSHRNTQTHIRPIKLMNAFSWLLSYSCQHAKERSTQRTQPSEQVFAWFRLIMGHDILLSVFFLHQQLVPRKILFCTIRKDPFMSLKQRGWCRILCFVLHHLLILVDNGSKCVVWECRWHENILGSLRLIVICKANYCQRGSAQQSFSNKDCRKFFFRTMLCLRTICNHYE